MPEDRVRAPDRQQAARPVQQIVLPGVQVPVDPRDRVVLAVGVVVAALRAAHLVAGHQHRHAGRQQQRGQQVAQGAPAVGQHLGVVGLALDPVVPAAVVVAPVPVAFGVRVVVLAVVAHQVAQREAVVRRHEVDRREGASPVVAVQVGGSGEPVAEVADTTAGAAPEVAHRVAVLVVPLAPQRRELAHLVATLPDVPRFGDQLHPGQHRVLADRGQEPAEHVDVVHRPGQRGGQVEAETVDVHLQHPVAQRVHHQLQDVRVAHVEGVAAAGVVGVAAPVVAEPVVRRVVQTAESQREAVLGALRGVVVDDVEDHFQAGVVQGLHHRLELADLLPAPVGPARRVRRVRGEVADGVVAPVVGQAARADARLGDEVVHREQLDRADAERDEVLDRGRVGQPGVRPAQLLGNRGMLPGEAAHVQLVDHGVRPRRRRRAVVPPVETVPYDDGGGHGPERVAVVPDQVLPGRVGPRPEPVPRGVAVDLGLVAQLGVDRPRVRVEQQLVRVEPQAARRVPRAVRPEAVALARPDPGQVAVPDVEGALRQRVPGLAAGVVEQAQLDRVRVVRPEGEVRALAVRGGAERCPRPRPGQARVLGHARHPARLG